MNSSKRMKAVSLLVSLASLSLFLENGDFSGNLIFVQAFSFFPSTRPQSQDRASIFPNNRWKLFATSSDQGEDQSSTKEEEEEVLEISESLPPVSNRTTLPSLLDPELLKRIQSIPVEGLVNGQTTLGSVLEGAIQNKPVGCPVIMSCLSHFGDFNAWELTQQYMAALDYGLIGMESPIVLVGIGSQKSANKFAEDLDLSYYSDAITLVADPSGAVTEALGCYKGWITIDPEEAERFGQTAQLNPYVRLMGMIFGFGSPGTIPHVLIGYTGDILRRRGVFGRKWVEDALMQGSYQNRFPKLTEKDFAQVPPESNLRPFELATLRLQTGLHIVTNWRKLGPKDGTLFTRMGGTFVLCSNEDREKREELFQQCIYSWYDPGILSYANVTAVAESVQSVVGEITPRPGPSLRAQRAEEAAKRAEAKRKQMEEEALRIAEETSALLAQIEAEQEELRQLQAREALRIEEEAKQKKKTQLAREREEALARAREGSGVNPFFAQSLQKPMTSPTEPSDRDAEERQETLAPSGTSTSADIGPGAFFAKSIEPTNVSEQTDVETRPSPETVAEKAMREVEEEAARLEIEARQLSEANLILEAQRAARAERERRLAAEESTPKLGKQLRPRPPPISPASDYAARIEEMARLAAQKEEEEKLRLEEEARLQEERKRREETIRQEEEARKLAEEQEVERLRLAEEERFLREEEARLEEEARVAEEQEAERLRLAEQARLKQEEESRLEEEARRAEEIRQQEEQARLDEERRLAEEEAELARQAEEVRRLAEEIEAEAREIARLEEEEEKEKLEERARLEEEASLYDIAAAFSRQSELELTEAVNGRTVEESAEAARTLADDFERIAREAEELIQRKKEAEIFQRGLLEEQLKIKKTATEAAQAEQQRLAEEALRLEAETAAASARAVAEELERQTREAEKRIELERFHKSLLSEQLRFNAIAREYAKLEALRAAAEAKALAEELERKAKEAEMIAQQKREAEIFHRSLLKDQLYFTKISNELKRQEDIRLAEERARQEADAAAAAAALAEELERKAREAEALANKKLEMERFHRNMLAEQLRLTKVATEIKREQERLASEEQARLEAEAAATLAEELERQARESAKKIEAESFHRSLLSEQLRQNAIAREYAKLKALRVAAEAKALAEELERKAKDAEMLAERKREVEKFHRTLLSEQLRQNAIAREYAKLEALRAAAEAKALAEELERKAKEAELLAERKRAVEKFHRSLLHDQLQNTKIANELKKQEEIRLAQERARQEAEAAALAAKLERRAREAEALARKKVEREGFHRSMLAEQLRLTKVAAKLKREQELRAEAERLRLEAEALEAAIAAEKERKRQASIQAAKEAKALLKKRIEEERVQRGLLERQLEDTWIAREVAKEKAAKQARLEQEAAEARARQEALERQQAEEAARAAEVARQKSIAAERAQRDLLENQLEIAKETRLRLLREAEALARQRRAQAEALALQREMERQKAEQYMLQQRQREQIQRSLLSEQLLQTERKKEVEREAQRLAMEEQARLELAAQEAQRLAELERARAQAEAEELERQVAARALRDAELIAIRKMEEARAPLFDRVDMNAVSKEVAKEQRARLQPQAPPPASGDYYFLDLDENGEPRKMSPEEQSQISQDDYFFPDPDFRTSL